MDYINANLQGAHTSPKNISWTLTIRIDAWKRKAFLIGKAVLFRCQLVVFREGQPTPTPGAHSRQRSACYGVGRRHHFGGLPFFFYRRCVFKENFQDILTCSPRQMAVVLCRVFSTQILQTYTPVFKHPFYDVGTNLWSLGVAMLCSEDVSVQLQQHSNKDDVKLKRED